MQEYRPKNLKFYPMKPSKKPLFMREKKSIALAILSWAALGVLIFICIWIAAS